MNRQTELAPVALFVYNRPEHARKTVESLRQSDLASRSDLFIFSDASKSEAEARAVEQVRQYIRGIEGFRSVTIRERDRHFGLANSIILGVTQVCEEYGRTIVMEDDLVTTRDFLIFMNQALVKYQNNSQVFSVSGFNFALRVNGFPYDAFCSYRSSSLGWGTWNDRWSQVDWSISDYQAFCNNKEEQRSFQRAGEDLPRMLALQMEGKIDSWAIRWAYAHYKHNAFALLSLLPRVFHIGSDGSGTHTRRKSLKQSPLTLNYESDFTFPPNDSLEPQYVAELQNMVRASAPRKVARFILDRLVRNGRRK